MDSIVTMRLDMFKFYVHNCQKDAVCDDIDPTQLLAIDENENILIE